MSVTKEIIHHSFVANSNCFGSLTVSGEHGTYPRRYALYEYIDSSKYFVCNASTGYWQLNQGSGRSSVLYQYKIKCADTVSSPNRMPKDWTIQGSNNGSDWTTVDTVSGETGWARLEYRTYTCDSYSTAYTYYKIVVTANNGDGSYFEIGEIYLYASFETVADSGWESNLFTDTGAISSETEYSGSYIDNYAVDSNDTTRWSSAINHKNSWLKYDFGSGNSETIQKIRIKGYAYSGLSTVNLFLFWGSNDASTWTLLYADIHPADENWAAYTFENDTAYRYYELDVSSRRDEASLYGLEAFAKTPGWTGKICGVTNPSKICGIAVADIAKVSGI